MPRYAQALGTLADTDMIVREGPPRESAPDAGPARRPATRRPARRPLRAGARRAHLPHLGADLRMQPRVRALPLELGTPRSARADDRRVQGRHRRAPADAGVLREHRRRRADRAQGLLGAARLRHRAPGRREVLHQRQSGSRRRSRAGWPPATTSTSRSRSTARPPRSTTRARRRARTPPRSGRWRTSPTRASRGFKISVVVHPAERRPARRLQGASPTGTRRSCGSPGCGRRAAAPTCGTSCTRPPRSSASCTTGWWRNGESVLTGDSFFHLAAFGEALPGLNLCGAGRVVCLIDPVGDVYACPFAIHESFLAGNVRSDGGFTRVWRESDLFLELRGPQTGGACTSCSALRHVPRRLHGREVLHRAAARRSRPRVRARATGRRRWPRWATPRSPKPSLDHSKLRPRREREPVALPMIAVAAGPRLRREPARASFMRWQPLVRDGRGGAAAREEDGCRARSTARWSPGRRRASRSDDNLRRVRGARLRPARRPGCRRSASWRPRCWGSRSRCR